jgi:hypothetical protein
MGLWILTTGIVFVLCSVLTIGAVRAEMLSSSDDDDDDDDADTTKNKKEVTRRAVAMV